MLNDLLEMSKSNKESKKLIEDIIWNLLENRCIYYLDNAIETISDLIDQPKTSDPNKYSISMFKMLCDNYERFSDLFYLLGFRLEKNRHLISDRDYYQTFFYLNPLDMKTADLDLLDSGDVLIISSIYLQTNGGKTGIYIDTFIKELIENPSIITFSDLTFEELQEIIKPSKQPQEEHSISKRRMITKLDQRIKNLEKNDFFRIIEGNKGEKIFSLGPAAFKLTQELIRLEKVRVRGSSSEL